MKVTIKLCILLLCACSVVFIILCSKMVIGVEKRSTVIRSYEQSFKMDSFDYIKDGNVTNSNHFGRRNNLDSKKSLDGYQSSEGSLPSEKRSIVTQNRRQAEELSKNNHEKIRNNVPNKTHISDKELSHLEIQLLRKRFPRIMIIGFGKTGTRALFELLKLRPDIRGPKVEKRFFSDHYEKGLRSYLYSLPEASQDGWVIEKSPDYIIDDYVPFRISTSASVLKIKPETLKFIVVLRDPIDRAMSEYLEWKVARKGKLPPFHSMVMLKNGSLNNNQPFIRASNYTRYIKRWFEYFDKNQTCFVDGDRFSKDPYLEAHILEQCLGIKPYFAKNNFIYNSKRGFYCFTSSQQQLLCMNRSKGRKHPVIPPVVFEKLQKHYFPVYNEIFDLTGRQMQWHSLV